MGWLKKKTPEEMVAQFERTAAIQESRKEYDSKKRAVKFERMIVKQEEKKEKQDWLKQLSQKEKEARRKAYEEQKLKAIQYRAKYSTAAAERKIKAKYAPRPVRTSNINYSPMSMQPSGMMSPSYFATAKPKTLPKIVKTKRKKSKRKGKKKGKAKYIIRGGVAYPVG